MLTKKYLGFYAQLGLAISCQFAPTMASAGCRLNTSPCYHRSAETPGGDPVSMTKISSNVMHGTDKTAVLYVQPSIRTITFNAIDITIERDQDNRIRFIAKGSVNPEDGHSAWLSDRVAMQYQAYDKVGKVIGSPMTVYFQLNGKGGNYFPIDYDRTPVNVPFDDIVTLRRIAKQGYDVSLDE